MNIKSKIMVFAFVIIQIIPCIIGFCICLIWGGFMDGWDIQISLYKKYKLK
jgi:hypothetical protein